MPGDATLAITGGTVLAPARSVVADVAIVGGRIVSGAADVGTTEAIHGGTGRGDHGTVGAGAERPVVGSSVGHHVLPVAGGTVPAAGTDVAPSIEATGLLVAPGLVDLQCNGAGGSTCRPSPSGCGRWRRCCPGGVSPPGCPRS